MDWFPAGSLESRVNVWVGSFWGYPKIRVSWNQHPIKCFFKKQALGAIDSRTDSNQFARGGGSRKDLPGLDFQAQHVPGSSNCPKRMLPYEFIPLFKGSLRVMFVGGYLLVGCFLARRLQNPKGDDPIGLRLTKPRPDRCDHSAGPQQSQQPARHIRPRAPKRPQAISLVIQRAVLFFSAPYITTCRSRCPFWSLRSITSTWTAPGPTSPWASAWRAPWPKIRLLGFRPKWRNGFPRAFPANQP